MIEDSKLTQARKLLLEGLVTGTGFAFGGFVAAAATDLFREWRTGKNSSVYESAVKAKRGGAARKGCCTRPTLITRI
jgi:hypothetical protein